MGSLLKFEEDEEEEEARYHDQQQERSRSLLSPSSSSSSSYSQKLVPWLSWDEWLFVEHSLFLDSPDSVASALKRILAWQSRGCLPVAIEVTASIIEIHQRDPHFRKDQLDGASINCRADQTNDASLSEEMLAMLYCMAIIRLVNGVVEKTRKKTEASIAVAAGAIGIPRMLIDIRHEGSHRELPALKIVRRASVKALDWLKSYYWEPQKKAIPFRGDETASIGEEIRSKLCELAFTLKVYQSPQCVSSSEKGKLSKKQITKSLKILVRLYSSFSTEVVSMLLEFLLKAINSSDLVDLQKDSQVGPIMHTLLDDWKLVITKLSNKEPELLLTLLKAVLDMIETQKAMENETGRHHQTSSDYNRQEICQIEHLSFLFAWLVGSLKELKPRRHKDSAAEIKVSPTQTFASKTILLDLLRKSLLVSAPANKQLLDAALRLAHLIGNSSLIEKLKKLPLLASSNPEEEIEIPSTTNLFVQHEESISQAAKKLELVKLRRLKSKVVETRTGAAENSNRWVLSRSWNSCPIGMLPHTLGSSGRLPVLDWSPESPERKEKWELNRCSGKREASSGIQLIDNTSVKKRRETMEGRESDAVECVEGHLMIGGIWKGIREDELLALASEVRILA
ncbi:uncharacterized protein LOC132164104 isoform X2 [Corylus avellana]|uniref:uncharacterized protein LOC132164104 isoform X2 n=1 Tax=Corylus avellana TaxID=13451 RepID=UPI00286C2EE1|nr:uncharacterized protein LOC132164104 isoform X2 [Corylus avellana]